MFKNRFSGPVVAISLESENEVGKILKFVAMNNFLGHECWYRCLYDKIIFSIKNLRLYLR
jgi:hypothetical protein